MPTRQIPTFGNLTQEPEPARVLRSPGGATRTAVEFGLVIAAVLAILALTFITQERINVNSGRGYDGVSYQRFAHQLADGERPSGPSRFVRRLGTPVLAALVDPNDLTNSFMIVNVFATLVSAVLLLVWFRTHLGSRWLRVGLVVLYAAHWLQLVRFTFFYPVLIDAWSQVFCFAGLNAIVWYERKPGWWPVLTISLISAAGVFFRELLLLIPLAFLFTTRSSAQHRLAFARTRVANMPRFALWIPLVSACATLLWIGDLVSVTADPEFSALTHFADRAYSRSLIAFLLGWMVAFGPALFIVLFDWRSAVEFLSRHKPLLVHMLGVAAIGWVASLESERHALYWASPVVYVLLGRTIERHRIWFRSPALVALLLAAQAFVSRAFLTTPQPAEGYLQHSPTVPLTPMGGDATYLHLFPSYMRPDLAVIQFVEYLVLGVVIVAWLTRSARLPVSRSEPELQPAIRSS